MIDFFAYPISAYCAKVRIVLDVKGIPYREIPPPNGYGSEEYRAIVPAGSIPAIRDGEFVLHDSDAVLEYLEDRYPKPQMRSNDVQKRAQLRAIARFHDTAFEPSVRATFPMIGKPLADIEEAVTAATANIQTMLARLESIIDRTVKPSPFLGGEQLDLTDCGFAPTIQMAQMLLSVLGQSLTISNQTRGWMDSLSENEHVERSLVMCRGGLEEWIASKQR